MSKRVQFKANEGRFPMAVELLREGQAIIGIGDLVVYREQDGRRPEGDGRLIVENDIGSIQISSVNHRELEHKCVRLIAEARATIEELAQGAPEFRELIDACGVSYVVVSDYGSGAALVYGQGEDGKWTLRV